MTFVATLVSLTIRHRHAAADGRHQIRWVAMGGLAVMLAHLLWVVGIGRLVGVGDEASLTLKVVATAIVAMAFQPLRQRLRRWADRVVYCHRATPYEVLAGFSQAASAGDEGNLQRIAEMVAAGTGAEPATRSTPFPPASTPTCSSTSSTTGTTETSSACANR